MKLSFPIVRGASVAGLLAALMRAPQLLVTIVAGVVLLLLLVYLGIALPAVWSSEPTRRKAAAAVLGQILTTLRPPRGLWRSRRAVCNEIFLQEILNPSPFAFPS